MINNPEFLNPSSLSLAHAWRLILTNGTEFYYTDHDHLTTLNSNIYSPINSPSVSTVTTELNFKTNLSLDFVTVIDDQEITFNDLRAGLFNNATIEEHLFNFNYPWMGPIRTESYKISRMNFTGFVWDVTVEGIGNILNQTIGSTITSVCQFT